MSITVTWAAPTEQADGAALPSIDGYYVEYGLIGGGLQHVSVPSISTSLTLNVAPGNYRARVYCSANALLSAPSGYSYHTSDVPAFTWDAVTENADGSAADVASYEIEYGDATIAGLTGPVSLPSSARYYVIPDVEAGKTYRLRMRTVASNGDKSQYSGFVYLEIPA